MSDKNVSIDFSALDVAAFPPKLVHEAQVVWADRVRTEYQSIQIAARFLTEALAAGEPMDALPRVVEAIEEEVRHTEICAAMCRALGGRVPSPREVAMPLADLRDVPLDERVLASAISLFLVNETFSVGYLRDLCERATHPVTRAVMRSITDDEIGHESFGVELCARKLRDLPDAKRAAWRGFTHRLVRGHMDRAERAVAAIPESDRRLDRFPEAERATLGLLGEARLSLLCLRTYRERLAPALAELGLA